MPARKATPASPVPPAPETPLSAELRRRGEVRLADKVAAAADLAGRIGGRPITEDEAQRQHALALSVDEQRRVLLVDWGTYVATERIWHNGALAYAKGHPVPVTAVGRYGYDRPDPPQVRRIADSLPEDEV